jgi:sulfoxide reductase heme-binding subunit YedZ
MQPATRSSNQLSGTLGTSRDWRRRFLLHHLPLVLASAVVLVLFMGFTPFTNSARGGDIMSRTFPAPFGQGQTGQMNHGQGQMGPMNHGQDQMGQTGQTNAGQDQASSGPTFGFSFEPGTRDLASQLTIATGYVATGLLALTLLIGPANLLLRRRNPVSSPLARDTGTWAAIFSVVHVIFGFQVHGNAAKVGNFVNYFFFADGVPKTNSFGLGNWTGLAALVIVAGLLALSNDRSLRELKARRWKNLQRVNYALFALVVLHAFFYGALLRTTSPFTLVLIFTVIAVFAGQTVGIFLYRRRYARTGAAHA